ncbi:MAG: 50S ribosomal protein L10 [Balneolaceae bacterium]
MPTLAQKKEVVEEITEQLKSANALYITNYKGMSVPEINKLRGKFREGDIQFKVFKNTMMKRAMENVGGYENLYPYLAEQNGFAFVDEELSGPAKVLKDFSKEHNKPQFKAALIDGDFYSEDKLDMLAAMKSKKEVIGDIAGLLLSPVSNIISGLQAQGANIASSIKTIADKGE